MYLHNLTAHYIHNLVPQLCKLTLSKKTSLLVNLRTAVSVSCTIPMTGLLDCGVTIIRGTMASSWISARVSRDCGKCRFISSPSKSALYGVVTLEEKKTFILVKNLYIRAMVLNLTIHFLYRFVTISAIITDTAHKLNILLIHISIYKQS